MSTSLLAAFYDIDYLCKQTEKSFHNLNLSSMLDKAVGSPVSPGLGSAFLRRHSTSNLQALHNANNSAKLLQLQQEGGPGGGPPFGGLKEAGSTTAQMNRDNRFRDRSFSENGDRSQQLMQQLQLQQQQRAAAGGAGGAQVNSTRYKTELCRPYEESGACKYGDKCQFAHGYHELRSLTRHPKYKTEPCRTFHTIGFCPYGPRCHFIHNAEERRGAPASPPPPRERPRLQHSLSFSGFSSEPRSPPPLSAARYCEELLLANTAFGFSAAGQELSALLGLPRARPAGGSPPPAAPAGPCFQPLLRRLSESPVFDAPPSPPDSLSDRDSYLSGSLSSSGSLSGSESPGLDAGRRLPIFSRISVSD